MTTWLPQLATAIASLVAGLLAYLATRRGNTPPARKKAPEKPANGNGNGKTNGNGNGDAALLRGLIALYEQARTEKQALEVQVAGLTARLAECEKRRAARRRAAGG